MKFDVRELKQKHVENTVSFDEKVKNIYGHISNPRLISDSMQQNSGSVI
jgi:hypothetical protein